MCSRRYKVRRREGRATASGISTEGTPAHRGDQTESSRKRCSKSFELTLLVHEDRWHTFTFVSLYSEDPKAEKQDTFVEKLVTQVIKNVQVKISNIHVRYEDDVSTFSAGSCIWSFYILIWHLSMCFITHMAWGVADLWVF